MESVKRWRFVGGLLALGVGAPYGCGRFEAEDGAGSVDAATSADSSAATGDGGSPQADAEGGAGAGCTAKFCSSFENDFVAEGWEDARVGGDAEIAMTTGIGRLGGHSFRSEAKASSKARKALLKKTFNDVKSLTCQFWVRVETANDDCDFLKIASSTNDLVWVDSLTDSTMSNRSDTRAPFIGTTWTMVTISLDGQKARLDYDGKEVATEQNIQGPWSELTLLLGAYTGEAKPATIEYDDVACDYE